MSATKKTTLKSKSLVKKETQNRGKVTKWKSVARLTRALGNTPDKIAKTLRRLKITGDVGSYTNCPLAKYYQANGYRKALVTKDTLLIDNDPDNKKSEHKLSSPVVEFVARFDAYSYLELVDTQNEVNFYFGD